VPNHRTYATDVAGVAIHCREIGDPSAEPVLLLHGGGSQGATWDAFGAALARAGYRAIAPDLRGHGASSRTVAYPLAGFRADAAGLLDALELGKVVLIGHSLGGHVASLVAQQQPERITRLVLEDPPVPPPDAAAEDRLSAGQLLGLALGSLVTNSWLGVPSRGARRRYHHRALVSAIRQLRTPDPAWWQGLASITMPTLVVSGGPKSHIQPQQLEAMVQRLPDARLATVPVGHRVHSLAPQRFRDTVLPFLAGDTG
jgi:pimeloyl-ACP methyl ester carboxylesterase